MFSVWVLRDLPPGVLMREDLHYQALMATLDRLRDRWEELHAAEVLPGKWVTPDQLDTIYLKEAVRVARERKPYDPHATKSFIRRTP